MPNPNIPYQYNSGLQPVDSTSPISGSSDTSGDRVNLKATIQRQQSQIEILSRELKKVGADLLYVIHMMDYQCLSKKM